MKTILPLALFLILTITGCDSVNETTGDLTGTTVGAKAPDEDSTTELLPEEPAEVCSVVETVYLSSNKVINGSFEEGHNLGNNKWNVFASLGAWQVDTTYNDAGIEVQNGQSIGGLAPSEGDAKIEFDAHARNGFTATDVEIFQEIDTDAASDYVLTFDYSPRIKNNVTTNKAEVYWDGQLVATLNAEVVGWQKYTLRLKGAGDMTRLSFKAYTDSDTVGGYLDNVVLNEIVEDEESADFSIEYRSCQSAVAE
jgi:hypothetical protein